MTTKVQYTTIIKNGLMHMPDGFCTLSHGAKLLGVSVQKLKKLMNNDMVLWDQRKTTKNKDVEINSLSRLKHPEIEPYFSPLSVKDAKMLQKEIDSARHKIASQANLPPCAVKIYFDLGDKKHDNS